MNRLAGKIVNVTGGTVGIARACVQRMAEEGAKDAIFDVPQTLGKALAEDLTARGHAVAFWLAADKAKFVTGAEIVIDGGYTAR